MREQSPVITALGRAGRRAAFHMIQAAIEGLKAIEAVIEEIGGIAEAGDDHDAEIDLPHRIEIE